MERVYILACKNINNCSYPHKKDFCNKVNHTSSYWRHCGFLNSTILMEPVNDVSNDKELLFKAIPGLCR